MPGRAHRRSPASRSAATVDPAVAGLIRLRIERWGRAMLRRFKKAWEAAEFVPLDGQCSRAKALMTKHPMRRGSTVSGVPFMFRDWKGVTGLIRATNLLH